MSKRVGQNGQVFLRHGRWIGRYYVDVFGQQDRKRKAVVLGFRDQMTKTAARQKLRALLDDQGINTAEHLEQALKPPLPAVTFNSVADEWELKKLPQLKPSTQYAAPKLIARYLRPFFGGMAVETIKTGIVNDWIAVLNKTLEPKSVVNHWKQFRAIMNWHQQQKDEPPRKWYPTLPTILQDEQRWFTPDEIRRIVAEATGQYQVLFHLAGYSGLRFGELAGLHVEDLDFQRGVIRVKRSVWRGQEVSVKTKRGYRDVWIDSGTVQMLRQHLGTRTAGRVFETRNGTPLDDSNVLSEVLYPILEGLSIPKGGMHAFRHGRVSKLQTSNVPGDFTLSQVGHSSLRITSGYTHFTDEFRRETVERLAM